MAKINLGCGNIIFDPDNYENHDLRKHRPEIVHGFDLDKFPYPLDDNSYEEVRMHDVLEHLWEPIKVIDEIHRILKPNGLFECRVLGERNPNAWTDPTHKRPYNYDSFDFFDDSTPLGKEYGFYSERRWRIERKAWDRNGNVRVWMRTIK